MRLSIAAVMVAFGIACATRDAALVKTEVVTFPKGALVQYQGHYLGREPVQIVLPQDRSGKLTQRAEIRALPNTDQALLYPQSRVFDPAIRRDPVPKRIMIDMTLRGTNEVAVPQRPTTHVETASSSSASPKIKKVERSKPTEAVGLDRWSPGNY